MVVIFMMLGIYWGFEVAKTDPAIGFFMAFCSILMPIANSFEERQSRQ